VFITGILLIWLFGYGFFVNDYAFYNFQGMAFLILFISAAVIVSLLLTLLIRKEQELMLFLSVFIFLSAIVGGSIVPIHYMPESMKAIAKWTPNYFGIRGLLFIKNNIQSELTINMMLILSAFNLLGVGLLYVGYKRWIRRGFDD
jgi:ABC-2 type transport system permease protein